MNTAFELFGFSNWKFLKKFTDLKALSFNISSIINYRKHWLSTKSLLIIIFIIIYGRYGRRIHSFSPWKEDKEISGWVGMETICSWGVKVLDIRNERSGEFIEFIGINGIINNASYPI